MKAHIQADTTAAYSDAMLERDAWIQFGKQMQPKSFLTLKFRLEVPKGITIFSDRELQRYFTLLKSEQALRIANELLLRIHQRLFHRSKCEQLTGIGCIETQCSGMPHVHLLISNDIQAAKIKEVADRVIRSARSHGKPLFLMDEDSVDVRDVFDEEGAAEYLTKLYEHLSRFSRNWSFPRTELVITRGGRHDEEDPTEFSAQGEGGDPEAAFA